MFPSIIYNANGGEYINSDGPYRVRCVMNGHIRANTSIGTDELIREGYTLVGWNTEPNGNGISYGLGSRCDIGENKYTYLYAQWREWTSISSFEYLYGNHEQQIIKYQGKDEVICIPEKIDGFDVTSIASETFVNCRAKTVIFPKTIKTVQEGAFQNCAIEEIYFYDNLMEIGEASFVNCSELFKVHINAILAPGYTNYDRHSNYADKVDLLRKYKDKKKIVLFGGCGVFFSVESPLIYEAFGGEYEVINMGLNGWFSATAQAEVILKFLQPGDILLHLPEMSSDCQLFANYNFYSLNGNSYDDRYMRTLEMDYDILTLIDIRESPGVFDSYSRYNEAKKGQPALSYSDNAGFVDEYGDYALEKPPRGFDSIITDEAGIRPELLSETGLARLNRFYGRAAALGARVFAGYAAVSLHGLIAQDVKDGTNYLELAEQYERLFEEGITNATVIGEISDAFYPASDFHDTDWHLSDEAAVRNTAVILENLKAVL